jgi:hypothetical protein
MKDWPRERAPLEWAETQEFDTRERAPLCLRSPNQGGSDIDPSRRSMQKGVCEKPTSGDNELFLIKKFIVIWP